MTEEEKNQNQTPEAESVQAAADETAADAESEQSEQLAEAATPEDRIVELETENTDLAPYGDVVEADGNRYSLRVPKSDTPQITARILSDQPVIDLTIEDPPIEEVIEQVFSEGSDNREQSG